MMTCKELTELLQDFLDGELPKEYVDLICHHLRLCSPCMHLLDSYKATAVLCRGLPALEIPPGLAQRLQAALNEKDNRSAEA